MEAKYNVAKFNRNQLCLYDLPATSKFYEHRTKNAYSYDTNLNKKEILIVQSRGPRKSRAIPLLILRAFVAYKKGEIYLIVQSSEHQIWWGLWISFLTPYILVSEDRHSGNTWCLHSQSVSPDLIHLQEHIHVVTSTTARIRAKKPSPPKKKS